MSNIKAFERISTPKVNSAHNFAEFIYAELHLNESPLKLKIALQVISDSQYRISIRQQETFIQRAGILVNFRNVNLDKDIDISISCYDKYQCIIKVFTGCYRRTDVNESHVTMILDKITFVINAYFIDKSTSVTSYTFL